MQTPDWESIANEHGFENPKQMFTQYTQKYRTIYEIMFQCFPSSTIPRKTVVAAIREYGLSISYKLDWDSLTEAEGADTPTELFLRLIAEYKSALAISKYLGMNKNTIVMKARALGLESFLQRAPTSGSVYKDCPPPVCPTLESPCRGCPHESEDKLFGKNCSACSNPQQWYDQVFLKRLKKTIMFR
jgi:hypothetical protein